MMLRESFDYATEDASKRSLVEARVESGRVIEALANALAEDGESLLMDSDIEALREGIDRLQVLSKGDDYLAISEGTELLGRASEEFASLRMDESVRKVLAGLNVKDADTLS